MEGESASSDGGTAVVWMNPGPDETLAPPPGGGNGGVLKGARGLRHGVRRCRAAAARTGCAGYRGLALPQWAGHAKLSSGQAIAEGLSRLRSVGVVRCGEKNKQIFPL